MTTNYAELRSAVAQGLGPISRALRRGGLAPRPEVLGGNILGLVVSDGRTDVRVTCDEAQFYVRAGDACVVGVEREGVALEGADCMPVSAVADAVRHALAL